MDDILANVSMSKCNNIVQPSTQCVIAQASEIRLTKMIFEISRSIDGSYINKSRTHPTVRTIIFKGYPIILQSKIYFGYLLSDIFTIS